MFKEQRRFGDNRDPRLISPPTAIVAILAIVLGVVALHGVV